jgi:cell division septation protein DedD
VPEMFRGRPAEAPPAEPPRGDGGAERSYTIDLRPNGATSPLVANPSGAGDPAATPVPAATPAAAPATVPAAAPATAGAQPAPAPATHPAEVPVQQAAPRPGPAAQAPPAAAPRKAPQAGEWVVQVGSFAHADLARQMVRQVRARGFTVEAVGPDDKGLYRVRSTPFREREAALGLKARMVEKGLKPIVTGVH